MFIRSLSIRIALLVSCSYMFIGVAGAQDIRITFIGNCAFKIQLDTLLLFSDFPYKSGAYGYMTYELDSVYHGEEGMTLITHKHDDHFKGSVHSRTRLQKVGPKVTHRKKKKLMEKHGVDIRRIKTKHTFSYRHSSYAVSWKGRKIYFTGDTESYDKLLQEKDFDILFITPWLLNQLVRNDIKLSANKIILYHHRASDETFRKENANICGCEFIVPQQNATYSI